MLSPLFAAVLGLAQAPPPAPTTPPPASAAPAPAPAPPAPAPLAFASENLPFAWDRIIPLTMNLDGLKVSSIFFNQRRIQSSTFSFFNSAEFGTRAQVEVTNTGKHPKVPGFAVAVLDRDGRLLGVASGGTKFGTLKPGDTETFDLNFDKVGERLSTGARFLLTLELRN